MSNVERPQQPPTEIESIEALDTVTGGCAPGGCYGGCGRVAYTRSSGFGFDPVFMLFALSLFSSNNGTK